MNGYNIGGGNGANVHEAFSHADDALNELDCQIDRMRGLHALFQQMVEHMDGSTLRKGGPEAQALHEIMDGLHDRISEAGRLSDEAHTATRKMREKATG